MAGPFDEDMLTARDRRREVASVLAKGVVRWRRRARVVGLEVTRESPVFAEKSLELHGETRLSVAGGTHGLCPRDDGDEV